MDFAKERHLKNQATLLRLKNKIINAHELISEVKRLKMENETLQSESDQKERISIFEKQKSSEIIEKLEKSIEFHQELIKKHADVIMERDEKITALTKQVAELGDSLENALESQLSESMEYEMQLESLRADIENQKSSMNSLLQERDLVISHMKEEKEKEVKRLLARVAELELKLFESDNAAMEESKLKAVKSIVENTQVANPEEKVVLDDKVNDNNDNIAVEEDDDDDDYLILDTFSSQESADELLSDEEGKLELEPMNIISSISNNSDSQTTSILDSKANSILDSKANLNSNSNVDSKANQNQNQRPTTKLISFDDIPDHSKIELKNNFVWLDDPFHGKEVFEILLKLCKSKISHERPTPFLDYIKTVFSGHNGTIIPLVKVPCIAMIRIINQVYISLSSTSMLVHKVATLLPGIPLTLSPMSEFKAHVTQVELNLIKTLLWWANLSEKSDFVAFCNNLLVQLWNHVLGNFDRILKDITACRGFLYKALLWPDERTEVAIVTFSQLWKEVISPERKVSAIDSEFVGILRCIYYIGLDRQGKGGGRADGIGSKFSLNSANTVIIESQLKWQKPGNPVVSLAQIGFGIVNRIRKRLLQSLPALSETTDDVYCLYIVAKHLGWSWCYHECLGKCLWPLLSDLGPSHNNLPTLLETIVHLVVTIGYESVGPYHQSIQFIRERICAPLYSDCFSLSVKKIIVSKVLQLLPHNHQRPKSQESGNNLCNHNKNVIRAWLPLVIWWKDLTEEEQSSSMLNLFPSSR